MSLTLLFPAALAALAALLLPLLVHLARREEHAPLPFAALRWLRMHAHPRRRIRLSEWPLLLVRLLLFALLALLLARPQLLGGKPDTTPVVAVAPGLEASTLPATPPAARRVWLAPGFPGVDEGPAPGRAQPLSSLLRELDAQLPAGTSLTVMVPARLSGTDGEVPRLARAVDWQVLPDPGLHPGNDCGSGPGRDHCDGDTSGSIRGQATDAAPALVIRHDDEGAGGVRYLRAVQRAWTPGHEADVAADSMPLPALRRDQVLVWLSAAPLPATALQHLHAGGSVVLDARQPHDENVPALPHLHDARGSALIEQQDTAGTTGLRLRFTAPLQPAAAPLLLDPSFPHRLRTLLQPPPVPQVADAVDHAPRTGAALPPPAPIELAPWLILAIALLFALERWLATRPRRQAAA